MFLHLNYATDVIGSGVAEKEGEEECRGSSYTPPRDQRASATLGDLFQLSRMPPSIYKSVVFSKSTCESVLKEYRHTQATVATGSLYDKSRAI